MDGQSELVPAAVIEFHTQEAAANTLLDGEGNLASSAVEHSTPPLEPGMHAHAATPADVRVVDLDPG